MYNISEKTIASISTALSPSGVGIIRVSGDDSISIVSKIFKTKEKKDIDIRETHKVKYGFIYDKEKDIFIDEVLVITFKAPKSFTREDVIEIQAHGGVFLLQQILDLVIKNGATLAEPGEFTKRAFLNGRIDLSQAEAVMDIINSENDFAIQNSINQLKGNIKNAINTYKNNLLEYTAYIEACLDDPEHMNIDGYKDTLKTNVSNILKDIDNIIANYKNGKIIKEGIKTVILGKPNVGKSSLLNLLLNENRAIVTDIAGTTRDVIKESINLDGITLHIVDTAGLRDDKNIDKVEKIGIDKAKDEAKSADLILLVIDSTDNDIKEELSLLEEYKNIPTIILLNKSDLLNKQNKAAYNATTTTSTSHIDYVGVEPHISQLDKQYKPSLVGDALHASRQDTRIIDFSTITKLGFDTLKTTIKDMFIKKDLDFNNQIYLSNERQLLSIKDTKSSLSNVITSIDNDMPEDLYTIDLMDAITHLSNVLGEEISDDLANTIFSKFCMGK